MLRYTPFCRSAERHKELEMGAKEAIVIAADEMFGAVGFDAASTREIAERSGVNKALIHYHFGSKEQLLARVLDRYFDRLRAEIERALGGDGTVADRFDRLVGAYSDFLSRNLGFCRIVQREAAGGANVHLVRQRMVPLFELGKRLMVGRYPGTQAGELAAEQLLVSVYGMIVTYFAYSDVLEPLLGTDPLSEASIERRKAHVRRIVRDLLATAEREDALQ